MAKRGGRPSRKHENRPADQTLYGKVKARVYADIPKHSAYRSGIVVQRYKKAFTAKHGERKSPYTGAKRTQKRGLGRWFAEKWVNQRGEVSYRHKSDIYRPWIRVTKDTPLTHAELSKREIKRARRVKATKGRVHRFRYTTKRNRTKPKSHAIKIIQKNKIKIKSK